MLVAGKDQICRPPTLGVLTFHLVDELPDQIEDAVPGPYVVPEVFRGVSLPGRGDGRVAGAAEPAAVEGQEAGLGPSQVGGDVHPVRVHREVRETAAMGEERLPGITVVPVLRDRVLNILTVQWILEFGGEEGDPVEEERQVEALLRLGAVVELAHDREEVRAVQAPGLLVEAARGAEVGQLELAAGILDALAEHIEGAAPLYLSCEAAEEPLPDIGSVVLFEAVPGLGLGGHQKVDDVAGDEAEVAVVVGLRGAAAVAAGGESVAVGEGGGLAYRGVVVQAGIGAAVEERALDRVFEGAFGDLDGGHGRACVVGVLSDAVR